MDTPLINQSQLEVIKLRNEGKSNPEIAVILDKSYKSVAKAINRINKIDPSAIKKGIELHTDESKIEKMKARDIAIGVEEPNIQAIETLLRESYPKLFNDEHLPLALGTRQLINETGLLNNFTDLAKKIFFRRWVLSHDYCKACLLHQHRFDLEGKKVGVILPEELIRAQSIVKHGIQHSRKKVNKKASDDLLYPVLKKNFPHLFNKSKLVALSLDMDKQLLASPHLEGFTIKDVNKVLDQWKNRIGYQQAIKHQNCFTNIDGSEGPHISQNYKLTYIAKAEKVSNIKDVPKPKEIEKQKENCKPLTEVKKEPIIIIKKRRTFSLSK